MFRLVEATSLASEREAEEENAEGCLTPTITTAIDTPAAATSTDAARDLKPQDLVSRSVDYLQFVKIEVLSL